VGAGKEVRQVLERSGLHRRPAANDPVPEARDLVLAVGETQEAEDPFARVLDSLVQHLDREICLAGLWVITGFDQRPLEVVKGNRSGSSYSIRARVSTLVNAVTSFSNTPLVLIFYLGCAIVLTAGIGALYLIVRRLFFGVLLAGWPSLIVSVWLLGGLTIFCLGVIGIYVSKIFMETKQRPYTVIRQIYERRGNRPA